MKRTAKVRIEVTEREPNRDYPYVGSSTVLEGRHVLFVAPRIGIVLVDQYDGSRSFKFGKYSDSWQEGTYTPVIGTTTIEITQEKD